MLSTETVLFFSFSYIGLLFAIAFIGDRHAEIGMSLVSNPYIYALSLAVYCTAWTFYGSVGRAATFGLGFLPTYIGPTLVAALGWLVLRKIIRISKIHRITSIADFIASRYGKSTALGSVVTIIAVLGIIPYISLQLKAIATSYLIVIDFPLTSLPRHFAEVPVFKDTAFYIALILAVFTILFGTRHLEATERHEGLVAAIAFESIVKLIAFLAVGVFVTYGIYQGFGDIFEKARSMPELRQSLTMGSRPGMYANWCIHILLSMMAVMFLPRQFQVIVVENVNEDHLNKAIWLFPLYLLAINIFVLPIAFGGVLHFQGSGADADTFVLTLPMEMNRPVLALLVFIGGMSAATGMVIVATIALSTMICNDLVMPVMLRWPLLGLAQRSDLSNVLLSIRRGSIVLVLLLGYAYYRFVGEYYSLVSIGLISFVAVTQFAPSILAGIFWKRGTKAGAMSGLIAGFFVWGYTLVIPSLVQAGFLPTEIVAKGPFGIALLKPFHLFGLTDLDHIAHAVFWSLLANCTMFVGVSLFGVPSAIEHTQATFFVDVFKYSVDSGGSSLWRGTAQVGDLRSLLNRFMGPERTEEMLAEYASRHAIDLNQSMTADAALVSHVEKLLAGTIGSASARVVVGTVAKEEPLGIDEVMNILDETRQVIAYSRELEIATNELKAANERLKELDRLKDEFISTVTHELRTPLTSVRSIAEILHTNPKLDSQQHRSFTSIIVKESERLTRLINQVLDFQKIETGAMDWHISHLNLKEVIEDALTTTNQLIEEKKINVGCRLPENVPLITGDRDRLIQAMVNLISNAVKFCRDNHGKIDIDLQVAADRMQVNVRDNGIGINESDQNVIFDEFRQIRHVTKGRPRGSGLGLAITRRIIDFHNGRIWVESQPGKGSTFSFTLPIKTVSIEV
ncbi:MAG: histidine kinase [Deltaproteobacteria bacterium SG8_13]|nr:MAG: histidine kinase [Deltaproteobacteria bacterium SG8_13]